jgi:broad specificity phosphatase PhoE
LSRIYLIRHGQAGTRHSYDSLSDLGRCQARLLGEHFAKQGIRFASAISGELQRQRQTAAEVAAACPQFPEITVEPGWNEFDLDHVYRELAPILCEEDSDFRREFESMRAELEAAGDRHDADVHRRWTPSDLKIVQAWIKGHERYSGESWTAFHRRIAGCRAALQTSPEDDHNIAIFTSATPIGIWAALSLDVEDHRAMRLAGVLCNASYTVMRLRGDQLRLHTFNAVPHLDSTQCTYR